MTHFEKIRSSLNGLDAILLTSESNRFYACGFHTSGENDATILITEKENLFFTDPRYTEAAAKSIPDARILDNKELKPFMTGKIGFEDGAVTVKRYNKWTEDYPCEFIPISELMTNLRKSKDDEEIRYLIKAQRIAEKALSQLIENTLEGRTEKEVAQMLQNLMYENGAEGLSFDTIVASGPNGSMPHAVPTDKRIEKGELLTIDFGCMYKGYCSDTTRTFAVGEISEEKKKAYNTVLKAQMAGIDIARAGVRGKDVHNAAAKVIDDAGYKGYFGHSYGHSLGIDIHEEPNFSPKNEEIMPLNAVVSAEPGIYIPGEFGIRIEDIIILKEDGCIDITEFPKELTIIK